MTTKIENPFIKLANKDTKDYHLFTSSHPYMRSIGLDVFTTGTLLSWWASSSSVDKNIANKFLVGGNPPSLGGLLGVNIESDFKWSGWKPDLTIDNFGVYEDQGLLGFAGHEGGESWFYNDKQTSSSYFFEDIQEILDKMFSEDEDRFFIINGGDIKEDEENLLFNPITYSVQLDLQPRAILTSNLLDISPLTQLINLNAYMVHFENFFPHFSWDLSDLDSTVGGVSLRSLVAARELLLEIKASKNGPYLEWKSPVTFKVGSISDDCFVTEEIPFKLYLFDKLTSTADTTGAAIRDLTFVAPKQTATGKIYSQSSEDGYSIDPNAQVAAPLSLHYNDVTGKWEAGSVNILAKLMDNISSAKPGPTVESLGGANINENLRSASTSFIPATGRAMPIAPQNGNPLQWQPNYAKAKCAGQQNVEKDIVSVFNFSPGRSYTEDETVTLTSIGGLWHIIPIEPPPPIEEQLNRVEGLKWGEFTYFMTNSDNYFRIANQNGDFKFSPRDAEKNFHFDYYRWFPGPGDEKVLNTGTLYGDYGALGGYDGTFNTSSIVDNNRLSIDHGYFQTTSFDFLDSKVFGIRGKNTEGVVVSENDKCSIAHTNANSTSDKKNITPDPNEYALRNAAHCGIFFGCIFPDGYDGFGQYFNVDNRNFNVVIGSEHHYEGGKKYFSAPLPTDDAANLANLVFRKGDDRNNCRQATRGSRDSDLIEDIDDLQWVRAKDEISYGIFHDRGKLSSMPADVMLNASPSGVNGSPLCPIHRFSALHGSESAFSGAGVLNIVKNAFNDRYWLRKKPSQSSNIPDVNRLYDSAFDFKPIKSNHIMFRPLKLEAYVQFNGDRAFNRILAENLEKTALRKDRSVFQHEAYRTQMDFSQPASPYVYVRESGRLGENFGKIWQAGSGLKWGGELDQRFKPVYRNLHYGSYWGGTREAFELGFTEGAMEWARNSSGNWSGAGAYGVITTYKTVAAKNQIIITTNNRYGMGAHAAGTFSIAGGMSDQRRSWGVSSFDNSYSQENIHDLSVRIYHYHPKDQTLFDPRTFAVHHFNPGISTPTRDESEEIRRSRTEKVSNTNIRYTRWFAINPVDFQVPSRFAKEEHEDEGPYKSVEVPFGSLVFSDATFDGTSKKPKIIDKKFWRFNGVRIGKLLPFRYTKSVIGIPVDISQVISFSNGMISSADLTSESPFTSLVVRSPGSNYQPEDIIGSTELGIRFEVLEVNEKGGIVKLKCLSAGEFGAENTAKLDDEFGPNRIGPIRVRDTISTSAGKQFDGYYIVGRINPVLEVDKKPVLVQDTVRVAANVPQPTHRTSGPNREIEPLAIVEQQRDNVFLLNDENRSADGRYDIFFHFHNDITMTWLASNQDFHGDRFNASEAVEQFISAEINVG